MATRTCASSSRAPRRTGKNPSRPPAPRICWPSIGTGSSRSWAPSRAPICRRSSTVLGRQQVFLEVQRHFDAAEAAQTRQVLAQAEADHVGVVATNDVRYASPDGRIVHDVLTCAREKCTVDEIGRRLAPNAERWLKPPAEMAALFRDLPAAVRATRAIAERCAFTLADLGYQFPTYPVPPGETQQSLLAKLCQQGVGDRYDAADPLLPKVRRQLAHELGIIDRLALAGYFLVVWDIVQFAR